MMRILILQIVLALGSLHDTFATMDVPCNLGGKVVEPSQPCTKTAVLFVCVTPQLEFQDVNIDNILNSKCNSNDKKIMVLFPGFTEGVNSPWINESAGLLAQQKNVNILIVNYLVCAPDYQFYLYGVLNIDIPANSTVDIIKALNAECVFCYGHSFGGQLCGRLGQRIKVKEILASDPAGPCFEKAELSKRLDASDADFVQIVHVNTGVMGTADTGHVDHYPNGGMIQPGCEEIPPDTIAKLIGGDLLSTPLILVFCSHRRGYELILESLRQLHCLFCDKQVGLPLPIAVISILYINDCRTTTEANCNVLGTKARQLPTNTKYYFVTNNKPPYCIPQCSL